MLAIGRVGPDVKLLLLDEPYEGLAPVIVQEIEKTLQLIRQGITTIIVEQNAVAALTLADRAVILIRAGVLMAMQRMFWKTNSCATTIWRSDRTLP